MKGARSGSLVLSLFASQVNAAVLRAHAGKPLRAPELRELLPWCPPTTLRIAVRTLREAGGLARERAGRGSAHTAAHRLTAAGEELLLVATVLGIWLRRAPGGSLAPGSDGAKEAVRALVAGWSSTLMHALAGSPSSLAELDEGIAGLSYASLERRLAKMRLAGQVTPGPGGGHLEPFEVTPWGRQAIAPLCVASRYERRHLAAETPPITRVEIEAALLLVLPLVSLPSTGAAKCALAVHTGGGEPRREANAVAGITVEIDDGELTLCTAGVDEAAPSWALGTPEAWLDAVIDGGFGGLRLGGTSPKLGLALVRGLHEALFGDDAAGNARAPRSADKKLQ